MHTGASLLMRLEPVKIYHLTKKRLFGVLIKIRKLNITHLSPKWKLINLEKTAKVAMLCKDRQLDTCWLLTFKLSQNVAPALFHWIFHVTYLANFPTKRLINLYPTTPAEQTSFHSKILSGKT